MTHYQPRHQAPDPGAATLQDDVALEHHMVDDGWADDGWVDAAFDVDSWTGPEQLVLWLFSLACPLLLVFWVYQHLSETWADWVTLPIWGVGDLVCACVFVLVYGSVRAGCQRLAGRRPTARD